MLQTLDQDGVRELRLARPPANALAPELVTALAAAVTAAPQEGAEALVVSGAPGMFSAGLDVPHLLTLDRAAIGEAWHDFYAMLRAFAVSPIPVAAAITGHAPAGGAVISLFCDHRVMAEGEFAIGLNEVRVGIALPATLHGALARLVGPRRAARMSVEGTLLDPAAALAAGLVDELAPLEEVVERAAAWCRGVLALPRGAMLATRRTARRELAELIGEPDGEEIDRLADAWFGDETQAVLRAMVARLAAKKEQTR